MYPEYFGLRYCGYSVTRSTLTAHTPNTRSIHALGTAHTHSTHSVKPSVLLILPELAVRNGLDAPSILEVRSILEASVQYFEYRKYSKYFRCLRCCCCGYYLCSGLSSANHILVYQYGYVQGHCLSLETNVSVLA